MHDDREVIRASRLLCWWVALVRKSDSEEQQDRIFLLQWVMQCLLSPIVSALTCLILSAIGKFKMGAIDRKLTSTGSKRLIDDTTWRWKVMSGSSVSLSTYEVWSVVQGHNQRRVPSGQSTMCVSLISLLLVCIAAAIPVAFNSLASNAQIIGPSSKPFSPSTFRTIMAPDRPCFQSLPHRASLG